MKRKKRRNTVQNRPGPIAKPQVQSGFIHHCSKAMLLTASYQLFSVFPGGGDVQTSLAESDHDAGIHESAPLQTPLFSPHPADAGHAPIRLTCIGCTTGPDNIPCAGTGGSCTGCVGRQSSPRENTYPSEREQRYNRASAIYRQGKTLFNAGRYREALDAYLQAKSIYPSGWSELELAIARANAMIDLTDARAAAKAGDYARAATLVRQAISADPANGHVWQKELQEYERAAYSNTREMERTQSTSDMHKAISGFTESGQQADRPTSQATDDLEFMGGPPGAGGQLKSVKKHGDQAKKEQLKYEPAKVESNLGFDTGGKPAGTLGTVFVDGTNPFKEPTVPKEKRTKAIAGLEKKRDGVKKKRMDLQKKVSEIEQKTQKTPEETMKLSELKQEVSKVSDEERFLNFSITEELRKPPRSREKKEVKKDDPIPPPPRP